MAEIKWRHFPQFALGILILNFILNFFIVFFYAFYLGLLSRGNPDRAIIESFANNIIPYSASVLYVPLIFIGSWLLMRKLKNNRPTSGFLLGLSASLVSLVLHITHFTDNPLLYSIEAILGSVAGWLAAVIYSKFYQGATGNHKNHNTTK